MLAGLGLRDVPGDRHTKRLSGGQRARLSLAWVLLSAPDVLLLDEPTNHLSLALATQLEGAIGDYLGTVLLASHDRWLRHIWAGHRLDIGQRDGQTP
ncbi:hypothetical protein BH23ACT6_BH23ACT6_06240 [soil metagenome]